MTHYTIISATSGVELACVWAGGATAAIAKAFEMFPGAMVAVIG